MSDQNSDLAGHKITKSFAALNYIKTVKVVLNALSYLSLCEYSSVWNSER